ncbi:Copper-translocating P-type ATPase, RdxI [Pseudooceanicola batsensis HTCC2597]|uniref:Copper-translocating P-type ATPase, RdxI n=1 Tax=Pseudooceanicola batsensis (strain ATCC BAA-863 / DSM 15984 / KCTC 12145 / HTCC2597) TaxID=252305 RepID=A3U180_PSEBH|nr:heavy metal translocating P-type ATPase [Pseudooceanicola batsensis]EAQ02063.1 Copper-translocating P-type ATPase, RdxI [Pseudooceanicola batsensis HTCC2597]
MSIAACPGCLAAGPAVEMPRRAATEAGEAIYIALPRIHCAACIAGVERALANLPSVAAARVNLGAKRLRLLPAPGHDESEALRVLHAAGFEAHLLDASALRPTGDEEGRRLLARAAVAGFAMMNVMAVSVAVWSGAGEVTREMFHWVSAAIALPALAFSAVPFFASATVALRAGRMNMDVPIAMAILLAATTSLYETFAGSGAHTWFDAALSLCFFLLVGRYLEHRARATARSAAAELTALELPRATRLTETGRETVDVAALLPGDRIVLAAGARSPVDGIAEGPATLDRSALTGEAEPVPLLAGAAVCAGEVILGAPLTLTVTRRAEDSTLRRLAALVEVAETGRHRYSGLADRAARLYAPVVHGLAALAFALWWSLTGDLHHAISVATATLIITCPCALALAIPAVTAAMTGRLFRGGVLLKSPTALERLAEVDTVVFDKTGTLTEGVARLPDLPLEAASVARALAEASDHPVSRALAAALAGHAPARLTDLREVPGEGVAARWNGSPVRLWRGAEGPELELPGQVIPLPLTERPRQGAAEVTADLAGAGYDVVMLTGDTPARAEVLARRLGIAEVHAGVRAADKADLLARMAREGRCVLMVGDGLNDTGALAGAHASLAPASALDAARVASDGVMLGTDLRAVAQSLALARRARRRIRQNLALAALYNAVAIPVAVLGHATPLMAAAVMSSSSILVVLNAVRR